MHEPVEVAAVGERPVADQDHVLAAGLDRCGKLLRADHLWFGQPDHPPRRLAVQRRENLTAATVDRRADWVVGVALGERQQVEARHGHHRYPPGR